MSGCISWSGSIASVFAADRPGKRAVACLCVTVCTHACFNQIHLNQPQSQLLKWTSAALQSRLAGGRTGEMLRISRVDRASHLEGFFAGTFRRFSKYRCCPCIVPRFIFHLRFARTPRQEEAGNGNENERLFSWMVDVLVSGDSHRAIPLLMHFHYTGLFCIRSSHKQNLGGFQSLKITFVV